MKSLPSLQEGREGEIHERHSSFYLANQDLVLTYFLHSLREKGTNYCDIELFKWSFSRRVWQKRVVLIGKFFLGD